MERTNSHEQASVTPTSKLCKALARIGLGERPTVTATATEATESRTGYTVVDDCWPAYDNNIPHDKIMEALDEMDQYWDGTVESFQRQTDEHHATK